MLKSPLLFAIGVLVSLMSWTGIARASDDSLALSFSLPPTSHSIATQPIKPALEEYAAVAPVIATATPIAPSSNTSTEVTDWSATQPTTIPVQKVNATEVEESLLDLNQPQDEIGLSFATTTALILPKEQDTIADSHEQAQLSSNNPASNNLITGHTEATALAFAPAKVAYNSLGLDDWIFEGGSNSLVAHTVGSAEGTRQWNGKRTRAYYGHKDPGNGVWNLGTFSYQHAARTPEEADKKQLRRLKNQGLQLEQQATNIGISLSLEEKLNGLDLANQAPLAALGKGGYIERLEQAYRMHMTGFEAISWARTRAYIDPETQAWNAPGLGNNLHSISQDQERRMAAITKALRAYSRDETTVTALARLDSISLESPSIESDELSRWDIHLTDNNSQLQEDELAAIAPTLPSKSDNLPGPIDSNRATVKAPAKDNLSLTASRSTLSFGLPPAAAPSATTAVPTELPESLETEPLPQTQPSLERLLTSSAKTTPQPAPAVQFATAEEITFPPEAEHLVNDDDVSFITDLSLITTEPSTALTQIAAGDDTPSQPIRPNQPNEGIEDLKRFEDPINLGPIAAKSRQQASNAATLQAVIETPEALEQPLETNQEANQEVDQTHSPNNRFRWRIHIEDRVINRK